MRIQGLFAVVHVGDLARAADFYTRLFGREPDQRPMDGLIQWVEGERGVQVWRDADRAGRSALTIVVPAMAEARGDLADRGLALGADVSGDFGVIAEIEDPDGNRIVLAEPPRGL